MNDNAHFIQQNTSQYLEMQKRAWNLFMYWIDQADDDVMTVQKKQEFLDLLIRMGVITRLPLASGWAGKECSCSDPFETLSTLARQAGQRRRC